MSFFDKFKAGFDIGVRTYGKYGLKKKAVEGVYRSCEKWEKETDKEMRKAEKKAKKEAKKLK